MWELYAPEDWTQAHDLAADDPDKLHELQRLFLLEAGKYDVFPLDDRVYERFNADIAGRPQLIRGNSQLLFGGMGRLTENSILVLKNKSHAVTAQLDVPETGASGVIIAQGGSFGGWTLYAKDGRPTYCYNLLGLQRFKIEGDRAIPPGDAPGADGVRLRRRRPRQGRHRHALPRRRRVGQGRVDATQAMIFSGDETTDLGDDAATPVSDDYGPGDSRFTGRVRWVQIDIDEAAEDNDHLISRRRTAPNRHGPPVATKPPATQPC